MLTIGLALRSLANRRLATTLTVISVALSVALLVGVETVRRGIRESFAGTIRHTDLIVGARGGPQQLLLSSIFGLGAPAGSISQETYQRWAKHPAVKWTIPISLGDSYYGYRLIGTTPAYFQYYQFRNDGRVQLAKGRFISTDSDINVGSEVAERLHLRLDTAIAITHGLRGEGITEHTQHPFTIVGILAPTYTPIDRSLFITLDGVIAMHVGFEEQGHAHEEDHDDEHGITAFLLGTKNRFESLRLQREMNTDIREPVTAILPAVALTELWHTIGYAEDGARIVTGAVLLVGLLCMIVALYSTLNERRREMAILRSLGAGPRRIAALLVLESGLLSTAGAVLGLGLAYVLMLAGRTLAEQHFGISIPITAPHRLEWTYLGGVIVAGLIVGLLPAWRAYRNALQDGLTIRL